MTSSIEYDVFIGKMGTLPDGSQCLADATDEPLTDHYWSVWVLATKGSFAGGGGILR